MGWIPARPGGKGAGFLSRTLEARERLSWLEGDIGVLMAGFLPVRLPIRDMGSFWESRMEQVGYFHYVLGMFPKR